MVADRRSPVRRAMALEMRTPCEKCGTAELPTDADAFICTYECTFCAPCTRAMDGVCPNCGGELVPRPRRAPSAA
jgi:hypothetical protein